MQATPNLARTVAECTQPIGPLQNTAAARALMVGLNSLAWIQEKCWQPINHGLAAEIPLRCTVYRLRLPCHIGQGLHQTIQVCSMGSAVLCSPLAKERCHECHCLAASFIWLMKALLGVR